VNMVFAPTADRVFLVAHGPTIPSAEAWGAYLDALDAEGIERMTQIITTEGGVPSSSQRRQLKALLNGRTLPTVLLSESARVRQASAVFSWLTPRIHAFHPSALREALAHLDIPQSRRAVLEPELCELRLLVRDLERGAPTLQPSGHRSGRV
jgi:hypothetical protein